MRKIVLLLMLAISLSSAAQLNKGTYKVVTYQIANSEQVITDGVFEDETHARLIVDTLSLNFYLKDYPSEIFIQDEWIRISDAWICSTISVKGEKQVRLIVQPLTDMEDAWSFSVYYNQNYIERWSIYKIDTE